MRSAEWGSDARPKYSQLEVERRWLADRLPELNDAPHALIRDRYITGTHLRLRHVTAPTGEITRKLCKKYGAATAGAQPITNLYLEPEEFALLERLPGWVVTKRRYPIAGGGLDVYASDVGSLRVFEFEWALESDRAAIDQYQPPDFAQQEITGVAAFSGAALARRFGEADPGRDAKLG
jgi:CYTH domain-containing protein